MARNIYQKNQKAISKGLSFLLPNLGASANDNCEPVINQVRYYHFMRLL